ncbi:MAG: hypothetical protein UT41_C0008G0004 [Candidatus Wolfebacteria bacterium GW2011_GWC2_39_22]|uniref:Uncharacterized protein n=1 Tax=Candidatus Wolfebacteria bacterium GW2011_GWC2_39_22 TaxID=1619013 RepID=A0A0G0NFR1_9BACT|nr:MAG: hypothetical protein UT41_C0008G0004 [Candidatus Wolfebacteria bacterium GW2011_GWC2_39_22]
MKILKYSALPFLLLLIITTNGRFLGIFGGCEFTDKLGACYFGNLLYASTGVLISAGVIFYIHHINKKKEITENLYINTFSSIFILFLALSILFGSFLMWFVTIFLFPAIIIYFIEKDQSELKRSHSENEPANNQIEFKKDFVSDPWALSIPVIISVAIDIFATFIVYEFQDIDSGCGQSCISSFGFIAVILYFISIAISITFVKKMPIVVGMWVLVASTIGLLYGFIFALPSFILLFFTGIQIINKNWSSLPANEKYIQLTIGTLLSIFAILFGLFRLMQLV